MRGQANFAGVAAIALVVAVMGLALPEPVGNGGDGIENYVERLIAGANIALDPENGIGTVTISSASGGGGAQVFENHGKPYTEEFYDKSYYLNFHLDVESACQITCFAMGANTEDYTEWDAVDFYLYLDSENLANYIIFITVNETGTSEVGYAFDSVLPYTTVLGAGDHFIKFRLCPLNYGTTVYIWSIGVLAVPA